MSDERELFAQYQLGLMGSFDDAISRLKYLYDWEQKRIINLENQIKQMKEESYKDSKISEINEKLSTLEKNCKNGFLITDEEEKNISAWKTQHINSMHNNISAGQSFSYEFTPTLPKTIGRCVCNTCRKKAQSLAFNSGEDWSNFEVEEKYLDLYDAKFNFKKE